MAAYGKFNLVVPPKQKLVLRGEFLNEAFKLQFMPPKITLSPDFVITEILTWLSLYVRTPEQNKFTSMMYNGL